MMYFQLVETQTKCLHRLTADPLRRGSDRHRLDEQLGEVVVGHRWAVREPRGGLARLDHQRSHL